VFSYNPADSSAGKKVASGHLDIEHLATAVGSAGGAGGVGGQSVSALRALAEFRGMPAVGGLPRPEAHLRSFTFGDSHRVVVC
jgi:hypothetical protein